MNLSGPPEPLGPMTTAMAATAYVKPMVVTFNTGQHDRVREEGTTECGGDRRVERGIELNHGHW